MFAKWFTRQTLIEKKFIFSLNFITLHDVLLESKLHKRWNLIWQYYWYIWLAQFLLHFTHFSFQMFNHFLHFHFKPNEKPCLLVVSNLFAIFIHFFLTFLSSSSSSFLLPYHLPFIFFCSFCSFSCSNFSTQLESFPLLFHFLKLLLSITWAKSIWI